MKNRLILMRGIPGSGKSTTAKKIAVDFIQSRYATSVAICSTDDFFTDRFGNYNFVPSMIAGAHKWNQRKVEGLMNVGVNVIIVDNTNTTEKEMTTYKLLAQENNQSVYKVEEVVVGREQLLSDGDALNSYIDLCFTRNQHGVPREVIEKMARRFEL